MLLYYSLRGWHSPVRWKMHLLWAFGKTWLLDRSGMCFSDEAAVCQKESVSERKSMFIRLFVSLWSYCKWNLDNFIYICAPSDPPPHSTLILFWGAEDNSQRFLADFTDLLCWDSTPVITLSQEFYQNSQCPVKVIRFLFRYSLSMLRTDCNSHVQACWWWKCV